MENLDTKLESQSDSLRKVPKKSSSITKIIPIFIILIIMGAGTFTGLVLSSRSKNIQRAPVAAGDNSVSEEAKQSFSQTFKDQAEGKIEKNDKLDRYAQGQWKLIRPGGESQTVYLTSSVMDLDPYVGKKVRVYGETFSSSDVGWLMDVGKVEEI